MTFIHHFFLAFGVSYLGSIPPGVLNLTIIDISLKRQMIKAIYFALAAAIIEFGQAFIALKFSDFLQLNPTVECYIQVMVVPLFFGLSIFYFSQKAPPQHKEQQQKEGFSPFLKGILLSLANPLAVIFWLIWGTYFSQRGWLILTNDYIFMFILGISVGSFATLMTYAYLSKLILSKMSSFNRWINEIIGGVLLSLAIYQTYIVITKDYLSCL